MNNMTKKVLGLALVAIVIAIGAKLLLSGPAGSLGAVATLDGVDNPFIRVADQKEWRSTIPMTATSSYVCAFKNPYNGTSTIVSLSAEATSNGIAVANNLYISTSSAAIGTSSPALLSAFAMGTGQFSVELQKNSATTTLAGAIGGTTGDTTLLPGRTPQGASNYFLKPGEWVTFKIATTTGGTFSSYLKGSCSAVIKKI